jgi:hypothetical protein
MSALRFADERPVTPVGLPVVTKTRAKRKALAAPHAGYGLAACNR